MGAVGSLGGGNPAAPTCFARHLPPARPDAEHIAWFAQTAADAARVKEWSCTAHDGPAYELCVLGAVWFIRRRGRRNIHETHRESEAVTRETWSRLLDGAAR